MNILELFENIGNSYNKAASTRGGEYKGPCPWCGGNDRFSIHPKQDHYVCRHCKKTGDTVQFYRDWENLSYHDACLKAGRTPEFGKTFLSDRFSKEENWLPRKIQAPPVVWQKKAEAVAFSAFKFLMSANGKAHREDLHSRGLSIETIKTARIGWNDSTLSYDRATWGLDHEKNQCGQEKAIWIPRGFIIPFFMDGQLVRLRIRQDKPTNNDRYILVAGSETGYFHYTGKQPALDVAYFVEAELDGYLCWQEFGDMAHIYAIGNTTTRPDIKTHEAMKSLQLLPCMDNDEAGYNETAWWEKQYPGTIPCFVPKGKDPGEAFEQGVNLRAWFLDLLKSKNLYQDTKKTVKRDPAKTLPTIQKTVQQAKPTIKAENDDRVTSKLCLHNYACVHAKDRVCLIEKLAISQLDRCPKDKWWLHHEGPHISHVILGFGKKGHFM